MQILYNLSLVRNMFTKYFRKVLNILKELTIGTDSKKLIRFLNCGIKTI